MLLALRAAAVLILVLWVGACASSGGSTPSSEASSSASAVTPGAPSTEVSPMTSSPASAPASAATTGPFTLRSSAFADGGAIPREFTCDGANVSPPLAWTGVPAGSTALVLVVDDPDARGFVHWIVLDLPAADLSLPRGVDPASAPPQQGTGDFGKPGWRGPCPPSGTHHYQFNLSALEKPLRLDGHPDAAAVRAALAGAKLLGAAKLTGTYART